MANETTTSAIQGLIDDIQAEVIYQLNSEAGILDVVRWIDTEGQPGTTLDFPKFGQVTSADVATATEAVDVTTNKQVTNTPVSATIEEHVVKTVVTDLAMLGSRNDLVDQISLLFKNAIMAKLEDSIVSLFSGFSTTVGGAGVAMTLQHWYDAFQTIKANGGNIKNLAAVISPKQFWGSKGLHQLVSTPATSNNVLSEELLAKGFINNPFGIKLLISNEIDENVAAGGDAAGGIFDMNALGVHSKGIFNLAAERDESLRGFELVAVGRWKAVELVDEWGVYFLTDVS